MRRETVKRLLGMDADPTPTDTKQGDCQDIGDNARLEDGLKAAREAENESKYPPFRTVLLSMISIYMAFFLTALDRTIIGVAIPAISNEFNSFDDIAWYESAFLLALAVSQFPLGKIYTLFPAKWTFLLLIAVFEIGSIICAAAPSSVVFIIGRAITGLGGAGSIVGAGVIMVDLVPLQKRPKYQGFLGAIFGLSSILGPLIGGIFATKVSWRWCFWINVPIGGAALLGIFFFLPLSGPPDQTKKVGVLNRIRQFDPVGNALLAPGLICLLLALQWGGTKYTWSSARIIALFVVACILLVGFAGVQLLVRDGDCTIPPRIIRQRSIAAGFFASFGLGAALIIPSFYLPIWFQAIKGVSAINSGLKLLPLFLGTVIFVIGSGVIISKSGYYTPWLVIGCAVRIVGAALMTTLEVDTSIGQWIGYQIIIGAGTGMTLQQCNIAAQTVLSKKDIPIGLTIMSFAQFFSGTISVSICQAALSSTLTSRLANAIPGFDASIISNVGASSIRELVPKESLPIVLKAYNAGIDNAFYVALAASCVAFAASLFMEWKSVR